MADPFAHAVVFGGTGMLADATRHLAGLAGQLTLLARRPAPLAMELGAVPLPVDWADPDATRAVIAGIAPAPDLVLSWLHDEAVWLAAPLEALLPAGGRSIRVHGAASRDPARQAERDPNPRPDVRRQTVILGWQQVETGTRWLTDDEVSAGAIAAIEDAEATRIVAGTLDGPMPE
ncbi:MAG: hypothetical protein AAGE18_04715 [Pseudomonadota bacterium]